MAKRKDAAEPCALTIAGLDPSGGAGIAADLRAFEAADVWGCAVEAVLTVQSTAGLESSEAIAPKVVRAQLETVLRHQEIRAIKTGALGSAENVEVVEDAVRESSKIPLVVDPVMIATRSKSGARLLDEDAVSAMRDLCRRATVVTPNADEAEILVGKRIRDLEDQRKAAVKLVGKGARAALVKGGHLKGEDSVADVLATRGHVLVLRTPRVPIRFHGGGCTLAALIAGRLAHHEGKIDDDAIVDAVRWAKRRLTSAIAKARRVGDGLLVLRP